MSPSGDDIPFNPPEKTPASSSTEDDSTFTNTDLAHAEADVQDADALPICPGCFTPVSPLDHQCPSCGKSVGQYTPNLPYEGIFYRMEFFRGLWQRANAPGPSLLRLLDWFLLIVLAPITLIGLPFVWVRRRNSTPDK